MIAHFVTSVPLASTYLLQNARKGGANEALGKKFVNSKRVGGQFVPTLWFFRKSVF